MVVGHALTDSLYVKKEIYCKALLLLEIYE